MATETEVIDSIENASAVNNLSVTTEEATQPNINSVSPETGQPVLKEESVELEEDKDENASCVLSAPNVGIRVKRELLAFDGNVGESQDSSEQEPEEQDTNSNMVEFPTVWPCRTCGYAFMTTQELQEHQPSCRHTLTRPHLCNICSESFERKQDLNNHIVCHQTNRPHACRVCGNLHRTKVELMTHMLTHQVDKPHKCTTCGQEFQRHSSLTNHMKIHTYAAGRALIPPIFSPIKGSTSLASMVSPGKRGQSAQPERSTEPIPSFETLPVPGYSYYNSLVSSSNYASFIASKLVNNGGSSSKHGDQDVNLLIPPSQPDAQNSFSSSSATQITCLPDIGHPDGDDLPPDFQLPQQSFTVDDQNQFDNVPEVESTEQERVLNSYLSVKNAGLLYGIKIEEQFKIEEQYSQEQNTQQQSVGSPDGDAALSESQNEDMLPDIEDSDDEKAPSPSEPKSSKEIPNDTAKPHMCQFCGIHFARLKAYQSHMKLHDENWEAGHLCQVCGKKFNDYVALSVHAQKCMRGTRKDDDFLADVQSGSSPIKATSASKEFKHVCSTCDKRFATKQKLFRHMWIHRKKMFPCEACSKVFEEKGLLDKHRLEEHPPNEATPYACTVCGKSFTSRQTLWEHGRVHGGTGSGATLLWCQECNKSFASRQGYQIHTRTHTGERPYGCRYCMKSFRDGGTLRKHERIHTGERPHACPLCMRAFNQKVVLREHVRWVHAATTTGEPPLPCVLCGTTLPDREALCAHIVKHSDDMASEVRNTEPKTRRPPRRSNKVVLQAADGKLVSIEKEDLPIRSTALRRARPTATATATVTIADSMDDSSHSTPGSSFNFPKIEPLPSDLSSPQMECDNNSFYPNNARKNDTSEEELEDEIEELEDEIPIPSFSKIAPASAQSLRIEEPAPNVTVADIPYNLENDMIDPMAYMQVVTDISPSSQDVLSPRGK